MDTDKKRHGLAVRNLMQGCIVGQRKSPLHRTIKFRTTGETACPTTKVQQFTKAQKSLQSWWDRRFRLSKLLPREKRAGTWGMHGSFTPGPEFM
jgi:uncharacterized Zn finger protein (UPF0148 family)